MRHIVIEQFIEQVPIVNPVEGLRKINKSTKYVTTTFSIIVNCALQYSCTKTSAMFDFEIKLIVIYGQFLYQFVIGL